MKTKLAMQLTLTALVAGLVATAGAPSRAVAGCVGCFINNGNGTGYYDANGNGVQDTNEATQYVPTYRPQQPTPTINYQQQYAPQPPQTRTINTLPPAAFNAMMTRQAQQMQHQLWLQRYPVLSSHVGFGGRLPQMGFGGQRIGTGRGCGGWFAHC
jgi:hypothetical protein